MKTADSDKDKSAGPDDIKEELGNANLIKKDENNDEGPYELTSKQDFVNNDVLVYSGEEVVGAEDQRTQADRILANVMYEHPMLLPLSKFVYRNGPAKEYEAKQEFDGDSFIGDKMNSFTIDMGLNLLEDADVLEQTEDGYIKRRWPVRLFAHVVQEEYSDLVGSGGSVREPDLFERMENLYGISRSTFDDYIAKLHSAGIASEGSYKQLILNEDVIEGARIHE